MRMEPNSKLVIGAKLSILLLWLLLSQLVQCQDTFPVPLPPKEDCVLQFFKGKQDPEDKFVICPLKDEMSSSPCHVGIYCTNNNTDCHIEQISLRNKGLDGKIPAEVGDLTRLRILDLSHNKLYGTIPGGLGRLSSLYILDLSYNNLSGEIPPDLGKNMSVSVYCDELELVNMRFKLDLSYNKLNGTIPPSLGEIPQPPPCKRTRVSFIINLRYNQLSDRIPDSFKKLKYLTSLDLTNNQLSGPLPPGLGSLASIQYLVLSDNQLSGPLPPELGRLRSIQYLSVRGNCLSGPFPNFTHNWIHIQYLHLVGNHFWGPIPPEIFNLSNLLALGISDVENSNLVLSEYMNMPNISSLILRNCSINGRIPTKLGENLKKLTYLDMSFNKLTGDIPESLNTSNLEYLSFAKNMLNGSVPAWIGDRAAKSVQMYKFYILSKTFISIFSRTSSYENIIITLNLS